jgi:hypothetical protein
VITPLPVSLENEVSSVYLGTRSPRKPNKRNVGCVLCAMLSCINTDHDYLNGMQLACSSPGWGCTILGPHSYSRQADTVNRGFGRYNARWARHAALSLFPTERLHLEESQCVQSDSRSSKYFLVTIWYVAVWHLELHPSSFMNETYLCVRVTSVGDVASTCSSSSS